MNEFSEKLVVWQKNHGRHDLPWQKTRDPYLIWVSEIMLQQTGVATVIPYYERFVSRFPDIRQLAESPVDSVLSLWSGLGYYSRARNLWQSANLILSRHEGNFPADYEQILNLPGIGRSTAAAICAFAYSSRKAILDGNVKRVLARFFGLAGEKALWEKAEELLPAKDIEIYTQALMDLGSAVCARTKPRCVFCPVRQGCFARENGRIGDFPVKKIRKILPRKETVFYVLTREDKIFFERRPARGIWAQLYCFPEQMPPVPSRETFRLPSFEHAFTHFRLAIEPRVFAADNADLDGLWLNMEEALASPIPKPVRSVLEKIRTLSF